MVSSLRWGKNNFGGGEENVLFFDMIPQNTKQDYILKIIPRWALSYFFGGHQSHLMCEESFCSRSFGAGLFISDREDTTCVGLSTATSWTFDTYDQQRFSSLWAVVEAIPPPLSSSRQTKSILLRTKRRTPRKNPKSKKKFFLRKRYPPLATILA